MGNLLLFCVPQEYLKESLFFLKKGIDACASMVLLIRLFNPASKTPNFVKGFHLRGKKRESTMLAVTCVTCVWRLVMNVASWWSARTLQLWASLTDTGPGYCKSCGWILWDIITPDGISSALFLFFFFFSFFWEKKRPALFIFGL